jgi:hypothetical protein
MMSFPSFRMSDLARSLRFRLLLNSCKQLQHRSVECRNIVGLLATDPVFDQDRFLIGPITAGVADVVLNDEGAGETAAHLVRFADDFVALDESGGEKWPGAVANHGTPQTSPLSRRPEPLAASQAQPVQIRR